MCPSSCFYLPGANWRDSSSFCSLVLSGIEVLSNFLDVDTIPTGTLPLEFSCHSGLMKGDLQFIHSLYLIVPVYSLTFTGIIPPAATCTETRAHVFRPHIPLTARTLKIKSSTAWMWDCPPPLIAGESTTLMLFQEISELATSAEKAGRAGWGCSWQHLSLKHHQLYHSKILFPSPSPSSFLPRIS